MTKDLNEFGTTEKQILLVVRVEALNLGPLDYNTSTLIKPLGHIASSNVVVGVVAGLILLCVLAFL